LLQEPAHLRNGKYHQGRVIGADGMSFGLSVFRNLFSCTGFLGSTLMLVDIDADKLMVIDRNRLWKFDFDVQRKYGTVIPSVTTADGTTVLYLEDLAANVRLRPRYEGALS
jgi:hypothetical protein